MNANGQHDVLDKEEAIDAPIRGQKRVRLLDDKNEPQQCKRGRLMFSTLATPVIALLHHETELPLSPAEQSRMKKVIVNLISRSIEAWKQLLGDREIQGKRTIYLLDEFEEIALDLCEHFMKKTYKALRFNNSPIPEFQALQAEDGY